jgi:hypothetical protein
MTELIIGGSMIAAVLGLVGVVHHSNCINETKVNRVYQRLDEVKEVHDGKYQAKNVCEVLYNGVRADLTEIKADLKLLLKQNGN